MQSSPTSERKSKKESKSTRIYFDAKLTQERIAPYQEVLQRLAQGQTTNGDNVKKLANHNLFSIRHNKKIRILFTKFVINEQPNYLVLDILENHEYDKSKFLQPKLLKKYLEAGRRALSKVLSQNFVKQPNFEQKGNHANHRLPIKWTPVHTFGSEYMLFDKNQENAYKAKLPLIVEGPPGSGKTSVSFSLLEQAATKNLNVLYITQSSHLAHYVKQAFNDSSEHASKRVHIKHYQMLDDNLIANAQKAYLSWINEKLDRTHDKNLLTFIKKNKSRIYQEFRILSGYSVKNYLNIKIVGKKQTLFSKPHERAHIAKLYDDWQNYIQGKSKKYAEFCELQIDQANQYDLVIVDESQDLSHGQLQTLCKLAKHNNLIFCLDRRQNLADENPKLIYLKQLLTLKKASPTCIHLAECYRCPRVIMEIACEFNQWRLILDGGKHKQEKPFSFNKKAKGHVRWISPCDNDSLNKLKSHKDDADTCIITQPEFVEQAKILFDSALVHTPEQIKGLEYRTVIAYKLLDNPKFYELNKLLRKPTTQATSGYSALLSACFVAITRASEELIFIQDKNQHTLKYLTQPLSKHFNQSGPSTRLSSPKISDKKKWAKRYAQLMLLGLNHNAAEILKKHFKEHGIHDPEILAITQADGLCDELSKLSMEKADNRNDQSDSKQHHACKDSICDEFSKLKKRAQNKNKQSKRKPQPPKKKKKKYKKTNGKANHTKANLSEQDRQDFQTKFFNACHTGDLKEVKSAFEYAIRHRLNLNYRDKDGYTGLERACLSWHKDVIEFLLEQEKSLDLLSVNLDNLHPNAHLYVKKFRLSKASILIKKAIEHSDYEILLKALHKLKKLDTLEKFDYLPQKTFAAIMYNNLEQLNKLINPVKINCSINHMRSTVLDMIAEVKSVNEDTISLLLDNGADIFKQNILGDTPLMTAIKSGNRIFINKIIEHAHATGKLNDLLNTTNLISVSPIHQAFLCNDHMTIKTLLKYEFELKIWKTIKGDNFFHYLIMQKDNISREILKLIARHLRQWYFKEDPYGRIPFETAKMKNPESETTKIIWSCSQAIYLSEEKDARSMFIESYRIKQNHSVTKKFIEQGICLSIGDRKCMISVDINNRDKYKYTLLDHAVAANDTKFIKYLINLPNIDIYSKHLSGVMPYMSVYGLKARSSVFEWALNYKEHELIKLIGIINANFKLPNIIYKHDKLVDLILSENLLELELYLCEHPSHINNIYHESCTTPLAFAIYNSKSEALFKLLLKYGANPSTKDIFGNTSYLLAFSKSFEIQKVIVEYSKYPYEDYINEPNYLLFYPIHCAMNHGLEALIWHIEKGASPFVRDRDNFTLLHIACAQQKPDIDVIKYLIHQYPEMLLDDDNTDAAKPSECARHHKNHELFEIVHEAEIIAKKAKSKFLSNLASEIIFKAESSAPLVSELENPSITLQFNQARSKNGDDDEKVTADNSNAKEYDTCRLA